MNEWLHFLRPLWLLAVPFIALVWWLVRRREARNWNLGSFVAPHLEAALTINHDTRGGVRAVDGVALVMLSAAVASAGPAWQKLPSPWFEETAPLVVAMAVTDSMRSNDWLPSRLDRARFKVLDLVAARTGSRTALIAYAGSSHVVMPPSSDIAVLEPFLESLDPAIMPVPGNQIADVLPMAAELLGERSSAGTLLFVNDGIEAADLQALSEFTAAPGSPAVAMLVVGTESGGVALMPDGSPVMASGGGRLDTAIDPVLLQRVSRDAGVTVVRAESGDGDIRRLLRAIESSLRAADDPDARWKDEGWLALWPACLLSLLWFRRGWTMQW